MASEGYPEGIRWVSGGVSAPLRGGFGRSRPSPPDLSDVLTALAGPLFKRGRICRRITFAPLRAVMSRRESTSRFLYSTLCLLQSASNRIAFGGGMIYHAGTHTHYGVKSRAKGRDGEPEDFPENHFTGLGNLRAGADGPAGRVGRGGAGREGGRSHCRRSSQGQRAETGGVSAFPGSAARLCVAQLAIGAGAAHG